MTVNDLLKRIDKKDYDKVIVYHEGKGWTNVRFKMDDSLITIYGEDNVIFSDDK